MLEQFGEEGAQGVQKSLASRQGTSKVLGGQDLEGRKARECIPDGYLLAGQAVLTNEAKGEVRGDRYSGKRGSNCEHP